LCARVVSVSATETSTITINFALIATVSGRLTSKPTVSAACTAGKSHAGASTTLNTTIFAFILSGLFPFCADSIHIAKQFRELDRSVPYIDTLVFAGWVNVLELP
jgi:hypothetical protein